MNDEPHIPGPMTDEEYVMRVAEALRIEEDMLAQGYAPEEIDHFFQDCRQYEADLLIEAVQLREGHTYNDAEKQSFWSQLVPDYDDDPESAEL